MSNTTPGAVFAVKQRRQPATTQFNQQSVACPGCGSKPHNGGRSLCPAYEQICHHCNKVGHFARVCRAKTANAVPAQTAGQQPPPSVSAKPLHGTWTEDLQSHHLSTIKQVATTEPAPTISIRVLSVNGTCDTPALPDSGTDISAAGPKLLRLLGEHPFNLLSSQVNPCTADGHKMQPMGKLPVTFHLQGRQHKEDMHIYPDISGVIMSWKAAKSLSILPSHYPQPTPIFTIPATLTSDVKVFNTTTNTSKESTVISKYPQCSMAKSGLCKEKNFVFA